MWQGSYRCCKLVPEPADIYTAYIGAISRYCCFIHRIQFGAGAEEVGCFYGYTSLFKEIIGIVLQVGYIDRENMFFGEGEV